MKLSIVIVNYNVKHFLRQCLDSVLDATQNIEAEIFVVDNNSQDQSVEMVQECFPQVHLIANKENVGFSRLTTERLLWKGRVRPGSTDTLAKRYLESRSTMDEHPMQAPWSETINGERSFFRIQRALLILSRFLQDIDFPSYFKIKKFSSYHFYHLNIMKSMSGSIAELSCYCANLQSTRLISG